MSGECFFCGVCRWWWSVKYSIFYKYNIKHDFKLNLKQKIDHFYGYCMS